MRLKVFFRLVIWISVPCSILSGGMVAAMSERLKCGSLGVVTILDDESQGRVGEYNGMISAPTLGLIGYPVTMKIGGNWWVAEGLKISIFAGSDGYFAKKTKSNQRKIL